MSSKQDGPRVSRRAMLKGTASITAVAAVSAASTSSASSLTTPGHYAHAERKASQPSPVSMYQWNWGSPVYDGKLGAAHHMDVPASGNNWRAALYGGAGSAAPMLCLQLSSSLIGFSKTTNPDNEYTPHWQAFDPDRRATMVFDTTARVESDPRSEIRKFWANYFAGRGGNSFLPT